MTSTTKPLHYSDYLCLDQLLNIQHPMSQASGKTEHDEMLFIIVHQTYELWFKQLIWELDSILSFFSEKTIEDKNIEYVVLRIDRMLEISKLLIQQIGVLETMTPLDFLEFRDKIFPASGFQSFQFRVFENKLGLEEKNRLKYNKRSYSDTFSPSLQNKLKDIEQSTSLLRGVEAWLERTPFLENEDFSFWPLYQNSVRTMFLNEKQLILKNDYISEEQRKTRLAMIKSSEESFTALFDIDQYKKLRDQGFWKLSQKALQSALFIQVYRDQPILQSPFRLIQGLLNLDEVFTQWRYRHALLAKRMLGTKIGTGGSSGAEYLKQVADHHKVFDDFFNLTSFFIPRSQLPLFPQSLGNKMGFAHVQPSPSPYC